MLLIYLAHFCCTPLTLNYKKQEYKYDYAYTYAKPGSSTDGCVM